MATKTQTAPALSPARTQLKEALEAKKRAVALVDKADAVVDAANVAVEQARAEAVRHHEAAEDVVKSRLAVLKGEPGKSPDEIREARRAHLLAKEELTASDETLRAAQRELEDSRGNVARSEKVCASHATAAISESASDVISLWDKVNTERERLRVILKCLIMAEGALDTLPQQQQAEILQAAVVGARLPFGDPQDWKHLLNKVGGALSRNYAPTDPGPSIARARAYWAQFADALLADAGAEQAPLPNADSLFS